MDDALTQAANRAGLLDNDLLKLAKPDLAPPQAVAELQRRFPAAFPGRPKLPPNATLKDVLAEMHRLTPPAAPRVPDYPIDRKVKDWTLDELERFERFHGMTVDAGERRRREGVRAEQQRRREMGV